MMHVSAVFIALAFLIGPLSHAKEPAAVAAFNASTNAEIAKGRTVLDAYNALTDQQHLDRYATQTKEVREAWCGSQWQRNNTYLKDARGNTYLPPNDPHGDFIRKLQGRRHELDDQFSSSFNDTPRKPSNEDNIYAVKKAAYDAAMTDLKLIELGGSVGVTCQDYVNRQKEILDAPPRTVAKEWQNQTFARWYNRYMTNDQSWLNSDEKSTDHAAGRIAPASVH